MRTAAVYWRVRNTNVSFTLRTLMCVPHVHLLSDER